MSDNSASRYSTAEMAIVDCDREPRFQFSLTSLLILLAVVGFVFGFVKLLGMEWIIYISWAFGCLAGMWLHRCSCNPSPWNGLSFVVLVAVCGALGVAIGGAAATAFDADLQRMIREPFGASIASYGAVCGAIVGVTAWATAIAIFRRRKESETKFENIAVAKSRLAAHAGAVLLLMLSVLVSLFRLVDRE